MSSPFPGMNPYLEQSDVWHEFHESLCNVIITQLSNSLPDPYYARGDATNYVRDSESLEQQRLGRPDAFVSRPLGSEAESPAGAGVATLAAPVRIRLPDPDTFVETTIEIHDSRRRRVVTAIEVLSSSNKDVNDDFRRYGVKRLAYLHAGVSLVEIDLLRGGARPRALSPIPPCDYAVMVARSSEFPSAGVWPILLRDPLPAIPIPLTPPDADLPMDLQQLLHAAFDARSFRKFVYEGKPSPPLSVEDNAWTQSILQTWGCYRVSC